MPKEEPETLDMDVMAEQQLCKLVRQYRIMDGDRITYSGEASGKIKRQRNLIKVLRKEQVNIMSDLKIAISAGKQKEDIKVNGEVNKLVEQNKCLEKNTKIEKAHLAELDFQIKKTEKDIAEIKKKTVTDLQFQRRVWNGQNTVKMLENKLETYMKRFNTTSAENSKLRKRIDHLLKERTHFNLLWERLINSLNEGKKFMLDLIEQASIAYDQRDEWCTKLQALRARGTQDLITHTKDIRQLQRKLDRDAKLQEFLGIKGQRRILADLEEKQQRKKKQVQENMEQQLQEYKDTLQQIREFIGETEIERLASKFIKQEEENFALFNYVNELNHESENLSYAIDDLQKNIIMQRELNNKREKQQQNDIIKLEHTLEEAYDKMDIADDRLDEFDNNMEMVYDGVDTIFELLGADDDPIMDLLGDNFEEINEYNVLLFLAIAENSAHDIMKAVYYDEKTKVEKGKKGKIQPRVIKPDPKARYKHNPLNIVVPNQPCPLCVESEQVSDVIESLQFAQGADEVIDKLHDRLALPHALDRLHNVSACHLPQSRKIIQKRYQ